MAKHKRKVFCVEVYRPSRPSGSPPATSCGLTFSSALKVARRAFATAANVAHVTDSQGRAVATCYRAQADRKVFCSTSGYRRTGFPGRAAGIVQGFGSGQL